MAKTPEGKVKDAVVKILKEYKCYYFFPATGGFGRSGVPDIIACCNGRFIGIECKAGKNTPTPLQVKQLTAIADAGGVGLVINETNVPHVRKLLEVL